MRTRDLSLPRLLLLPLSLLFLSTAAWPQAPSPQSRVVEPVNERALVSLRGNTHPLAQPQYDRGAAPPDLAMARMLLVLKRSDAQEAALEKLLDDQQDLNSPQYHQWLTPDQFGQQFGPSDQDVQTVAAWLRSHGFQIATIGRGRTVIEFSGTAAQVQQAFHTEIHKYTVNGEDHWANASDPQIPAALTSVVEGVVSLHNFPKKPANHLAGLFSKARSTGEIHAFQRGYTIQNSSCNPNGQNYCYFVGPYDFATIYNVLPLWNAAPSPLDGTGQSIVVVGESNINIQDVQDFRNLFGLPSNAPKVIVDGPDPGLVSGPETEAILDVEWSGAVAPGANINLVIAQPTESTAGVDLAAVRAVEDNIAPIISESFLQCELFLGAAGNSFQNAIRQQASAQGITFLTASGDQGSAGCDFFSGNAPAPATHGLMVNGLASSPYGVAVGGTDFLNFGTSYNFNVPSPYWNTTNDAHQASALGYIPESTWNSTCTNKIFVAFMYGATAEASCNNSNASSWIETIAGSGGKSDCTTPNGSTCSGGYPKPSWQSAPGVPADGARDIPDVSLFASSGFMASAYIVCESDMPQGHGSCELGTPEYSFLGIGGTSASSPAFAGILALVNQFTQSSGQGNANYVLYKLASSSAQTTLNCNSSAIPARDCIFYDVTNGTIATPCAARSPNCNASNGSDLYGVLSGYSAGSGYDLATGLGSVNAYNLVRNWSAPGISTTTTLSLNGGNQVNITHGSSVNLNISVSPGVATGNVSLRGAPGAGGSAAMGEFTLQNGSVTANTTLLAGGNSYQVKAHYAGDGKYAPSDSAPVTVTVTPEPSNTLITIPVFDPTTGKETGNAPASVVYGSPYIERVDVGNAKAAVTFPPKPICAQLACPTGSVALTDSLNGGSQVPLGTGSYPLNSAGFTEYLAIQLSGGSHVLGASYNGDNSYASSSRSYSLIVTPAPTTTTTSFPSSVVIGQQYFLSAQAVSNSSGVAPTGSFTVFDGAVQIGSDGPLTGLTNPSLGQVFLSDNLLVPIAAPSGPHTLTARYSGDTNYAASTSPGFVVNAVYAATATAVANPATINLGQSTSITATVAGASKTPPMTGTLQFPGLVNPVQGIPGTDAMGNQTLTATATVKPQASGGVLVYYPGDANYESTQTNAFVAVNLPDFTLSTASPSLTVTAGQTGTTQFTITPVNNISDSVALSCSTFQFANVTCSFNPSPLSVSNGNAANTMLSVATVPPSSSPSTTFVGARRLRWEGIWPPGSWMFALAGGLAILLLSLSGSRKKRRLAGALGMAGLLFLVLSCGSSGSGGGGGGGGGGAAPTTLTLTTSSVKAPSGTNFTLTATVHSTSPVTGVVYFIDNTLNTDIQGVLVNGVATVQLAEALVGTHTMSAQYPGDANNHASQTGSMNQVITGTGQLFVNAMGAASSHFSTVNVTIQ